MANPGDPAEVFYMPLDGHFLTFTLNADAREALAKAADLRVDSPEAKMLCGEIEIAVYGVPEFRRQDPPRIASRIAALHEIEDHIRNLEFGFGVAELAKALDPDTLKRLKVEAAAIKSRHDGKPRPVPDLDLFALDGSLSRFEREISGTLEVLKSAARRAREKLEAESGPGRRSNQWERRLAREIAAARRRYGTPPTCTDQALFVLTVFYEVFETDEAPDETESLALATVRRWLSDEGPVTE